MAVLTENNPTDVARLMNLSKKIMRKMNENLVRATSYKVIAILVAVGILVSFNAVTKFKLVETNIIEDNRNSSIRRQ